jgi:hypothetical protein
MSSSVKQSAGMAPRAFSFASRCRSSGACARSRKKIARLIVTMKELIWPPWFDVGMETGGRHVAWRLAADAQSAASSPFRSGRGKG